MSSAFHPESVFPSKSDRNSSPTAKVGSKLVRQSAVKQILDSGIAFLRAGNDGDKYGWFFDELPEKRGGLVGGQCVTDDSNPLG